MEFKEIEELIIEKAPLPMSGPYEETVCFLALRGLYAANSMKRITKEQAIKERVHLKKQFQHMRWLHERYTSALAQHQEFLRLAGRYRPEILEALKRRAEPKETMELMIHCISALCQDQVFEKTALRLLEESDESNKHNRAESV